MYTSYNTNISEYCKVVVIARCTNDETNHTDVCLISEPTGTDERRSPKHQQFSEYQWISVTQRTLTKQLGTNTFTGLPDITQRQLVLPCIWLCSVNAPPVACGIAHLDLTVRRIRLHSTRRKDLRRHKKVTTKRSTMGSGGSRIFKTERLIERKE